MTFRFPDDEEIRYLEDVPARGGSVKSRRGEQLVVSRIEEEGDGSWIVFVVTPSVFLRDSRSLSRRVRDLSTRMRERTADIQTRVAELKTRRGLTGD